MDDFREPMTIISEHYRSVEEKEQLFQIVKQRIASISSHYDCYYTDKQIARRIEEGLANCTKFRLCFFPNFCTIEV